MPFAPLLPFRGVSLAEDPLEVGEPDPEPEALLLALPEPVVVVGLVLTVVPDGGLVAEVAEPVLEGVVDAETVSPTKKLPVLANSSLMLETLTARITY